MFIRIVRIGVGVLWILIGIGFFIEALAGGPYTQQIMDWPAEPMYPVTIFGCGVALMLLLFGTIFILWPKLPKSAAENEA